MNTDKPVPRLEFARFPAVNGGMRPMRTALAPWGRRFMAACVLACAWMTVSSEAFAQFAPPPPGFDAVPRPPGSIGIGPSQNLMPPGGPSGVLAPQQAPASPLQLAPPPAQPVALPPAAPTSAPPPAAGPSVPMVPAG